MVGSGRKNEIRVDPQMIYSHPISSMGCAGGGLNGWDRIAVLPHKLSTTYGPLGQRILSTNKEKQKKVKGIYEVHR
uniref:Uncharacterized protein n=1 Tax=Medicago truncatula TaxID=3880 RepID=A2Q1B0_MEDTR|nr:hypothetical protein MtrDRAFT_AC148396g32v2 [Medicago truncatula]